MQSTKIPIPIGCSAPKSSPELYQAEIFNQHMESTNAVKFYNGRNRHLLLYRGGLANIMQQQNNLTNYTKAYRIQSLVREARKNGFMQQILEMSKGRGGFDSSYRKNVTAYYKKKITKPFCLIQQPEYRRELRFNSDFNAFVKSIPEFQKIRQDPPTNDHDSRQGETLTFDFGKTCQVSPENVKKRKMQTIGVETTETLFPTKINLTEGLIRKKKENNQSRIDIFLEEDLAEPISPPCSPKKRREKIDLTKRELNLKSIRLTKSRRENVTLSNTLSKEASNRNIVKINPVMALQGLNKLNNSEHKMKNFRISKVKLHQMLCKKYGNEIITTFFGLQTTEDYKGMIKMMTQIITASPKMAQLITFLTFDYNQDGVITEDELTQLNNLIPASSGITEDINRIIGYVQQNPDLKCEPDLSADFLKQPTIRQYLKSNEQTKQAELGSVRGIYRLFSFKTDQDSEKINNLPSIGQKKIDLSKKMTRLNFAHFQKVFEKVGHPNFIADLVTFVLGKNYDRSEEISPRKVSFSKRTRKATFSLEGREKFATFQSEQSSQLSKAQQILVQMHKDNKSMATLQYD